MVPAPVPEGEQARLAALRSFDILDTLSEDAYNAITYLASQVCDVPIAFISLIDEDRQWYKSKRGFAFPQVPRDITVCTYTISRPDEMMVVPDLAADERFAQHPLVLMEPPIRFYAGANLRTEDGHAIGTLCVMDNQPREMTEDQRKTLRALATQVMAQLELRRAIKELREQREEIAEVSRQRQSLIATVSHEIRTPLTAVSAYIELLRDPDSSMPEDERSSILDRVSSQASDVSHMVEDLLVAARSEAGSLDVSSVPVNLLAQVAQVLEGLDPARAQEVQVAGLARGHADPNRVRQIVRNLLTNAFRYGGPKVEVRVEERHNMSHVMVIDDGERIADEDREVMFQAYARVAGNTNTESVGLGLSISRLLAERMGGALTYRHEDGHSIFDLALPGN